MADGGLPSPPHAEQPDEFQPYAVEARIGFPAPSQDGFLLQERRTQLQLP